MLPACWRTKEERKAVAVIAAKMGAEQLLSVPEIYTEASVKVL